MQKELSHNGISFHLDVESAIEVNRLETAFSKEPETIAWIEEVVNDGDVFLDVGANIGVYALFAAARHPHSTVYACEPAYHNFYKLCQNVTLNGFEERVLPLGFALSDKAGAATMHLSSRMVGSASHAVDARGAQKKPDADSFSHLIATLPIDLLVTEGYMRQPQHIKIDVDGMEDAVVVGAFTCLRDPGLLSVLIELDRKLGDAERVIAAIESAGFDQHHPLNRMDGHSRERRSKAGHGHIENIIFTRP